MWVPKPQPFGLGTDQGCQSGWADGVLPFPVARTYEEGLPPKTGIPGFRDSVVPVSCGIGADTVYSSTAQYRLDELVSVSRSCTGTSYYVSRLERPGYGPRQRTRLTGRDIRVQGRVYTITPRLSQQINQSYRVRFFYLAYGQECCLILVHHIHSLLHQLW